MRVAWILQSYLLMAGGVTLSSIGTSLIVVGGVGLAPRLISWGVGVFLGGYLAARASAGRTIIEPGLGAVLFVASLVLMFYLTPFGQLAMDARMREKAGETTKVLGMVAGSFLVAGVAGAYAGGHVKAAAGGVVMALFSFLAILGGISIGLFAFAMVALGSENSIPPAIGVIPVAAGAFAGGFGAARAGAMAHRDALVGGAAITGLLFFAVLLSGGKDRLLAGPILSVGILITMSAAVGGAVGNRRSSSF